MTTTRHATGTLRTTSWKEEPYAEADGAPRLSHDHVTHQFTGDIVGEGTWHGLNSYQDESTAVYTAYERVSGTLGGRSGTFVIQATGTYANGEARTAWSVVPGTGTGELRGIRGEGGYVAAGSLEEGYEYRFDYQFA